MQRLIGLFLIIVLTLAAPVAGALRDLLWGGYTGYASRYLGGLPAAAPRQPRSGLVVMAFVRGMGDNESRVLPALNTLRSQGASVSLTFDPPPFTLSKAVTLISGASPEVHGLVAQSQAGKALPDTVFGQLQRAGKAVGVVGSQMWQDLAPSAARGELVPEGMADHDAVAIQLATQIAKDARSPAQFLVVELSEFSSAPDRAQATNRNLQSLIAALDLQKQTLVVMGDAADVSHAAPMILAGAGVRAGATANARGEDVAPTLAALLGAPFPIQSQGNLMLSALSDAGDAPASAAQLTLFYENWSEVIHQPRFAAELLRGYSSYPAFVADLNAKVAAQRATALAQERTGRAPVLVGVGVALAALAIVLVGLGGWRAALAAALYFGLWLANYFLVARYGADMAALPVLAQPARESAIILLVVSAVVGFASGGLDDALEAVTCAMAGLGLVVVGLAAQVAVYIFNWGATPGLFLPDAGAITSVLMALAQGAGLNTQIVSQAPALPVPLLMALVTALCFAIAHSRTGKNNSRYR
ncbi:MAG TPA: alkaline phosphatase family protein [Thermoflexales bacterium]|nr:alkaline phosphatase family protein [Thermoflexales bacterium]